MVGGDSDLPHDIQFVGIPIFLVPLVAQLAEVIVLETAGGFSEGVYPQRPAGGDSWWKTSSRASELAELVFLDEFLDEEGEEDASDCEGGD